MHKNKIFTTFAFAVFSIFILLVTGQVEIAAQKKAKNSKTRKRVVAQKPATNVQQSKPNDLQNSKPKEPQISKPKEIDYDLGVRFEVDKGVFLFVPYKFSTVLITNRDTRPVTIKRVVANGEEELYVGNKTVILTIGEQIRVGPDTNYKKELIFVDVITDLGAQRYKVRTQ